MKPSRRKFIRAAAATLAASTAHAATTQPATTQATASIPPDDIAAALRALGHDFTSDEQQLMAEGLADRREYLMKLRRRNIDPRIEPAVQFNPRVPGVTYQSTVNAFGLSDAPPPDYNGDPQSLAFATAADLSRLIHARRITSVELTRVCLARLDSVGRKLNAVVTLTSDFALEQARRADAELRDGRSRGPLHGIPCGVKDLLATRGIPTTWGVSPFADQIFDYDATVIDRLHAAGAVLCAKLSLGELAMGDIWFGGRTKNPWNPKQGSGGSSAGPCAAVAAGCVPFAIGSETLGSIVSPCMTNGTAGLRPTYGRVSRYGAMALSRTMDKIGPIARGVEDLAMIFAAIHGPDGRDPTAVEGIGFRWTGDANLKDLRIGIDSAAFDAMSKSKDSTKRGIYEQALSTLRTLAGELTPIRLPPTENYTGLASLVIAAESAASFTELVTSGRVRELVQQGEGAWPDTFRRGMMLPAADYLRAMQLRTQLQRDMHDALANVDVYVTIPYSGPTIAYTNLTGHPTCVARCGLIADRPVMIEFVGSLYREDAALRLAFAYERANTTRNQWPDV